MITPRHIEIYCRIKSDPFRRAGFAMEDAVIFCEKVEKRLSTLDETAQRIVLDQAYGYSQAEIAVKLGCSLRTMSRKSQIVNAIVFAELTHALGMRVKLRPTPGAGRPRKRII